MWKDPLREKPQGAAARALLLRDPSNRTASGYFILQLVPGRWRVTQQFEAVGVEKLG